MAPEGSIRREILKKYKALGLKNKPNTGDNGVHASASPFEALAERANWLGAKIESDPFGKGMLAAGMSKELIKKWSGDTQISVEGETAPGEKMSVFDALEDLDADDVLYVFYFLSSHLCARTFSPRCYATLQGQGRQDFEVRTHCAIVLRGLS